MPTILEREPVLWQTLFITLLDALVAFEVLKLTDVQLGTLNAVLAAVLGMIVWQVVTPLADPLTSGGAPANLVAK